MLSRFTIFISETYLLNLLSAILTNYQYEIQKKYASTDNGFE